LVSHFQVINLGLGGDCRSTLEASAISGPKVGRLWHVQTCNGTRNLSINDCFTQLLHDNGMPELLVINIGSTPTFMFSCYFRVSYWISNYLHPQQKSSNSSPWKHKKHQHYYKEDTAREATISQPALESPSKRKKRYCEIEIGFPPNQNAQPHSLPPHKTLSRNPTQLTSKGDDFRY
ncbi:hypothetical protein M758_1G059500, partial [Ceratodon purpureus]